MNRNELRAIAQMRSDMQFMNTLSRQEKLAVLNPTSAALMGDRDAATGKINIQQLNGGSSQGNPITSGYIAAVGRMVPATFSSGGYTSIDAKPAY